MRLNRDAYERLVIEDIEWLKAQVPADKKFDDGVPHSLEARHIIDVLKWSVVALYEMPNDGAAERGGKDGRAMSKIADMTAGQLLAELLNGYDSGHGLCGCEACLKRTADAVDAALAHAVADARAEEREECAKVAEEDQPYTMYGLRIAAAIRARTTVRRTLWNSRADREGMGLYCPNGHKFGITNLSKQQREWAAEIEKLKADNAKLSARVVELEAQIRTLTAGAVSVAPAGGGEVSVAAEDAAAKGGG